MDFCRIKYLIYKMSFINYCAPIVYPRPMTQMEIQELIDHGIYDYSDDELSTYQYGTPYDTNNSSSLQISFDATININK